MSREAILVRRLVEAGLRGVEKASLAEQADLHEAASIALSRCDRRASEIASFTASLLRQSEEHQLQFAALLKS